MAKISFFFLILSLQLLASRNCCAPCDTKLSVRSTCASMLSTSSPCSWTNAPSSLNMLLTSFMSLCNCFEEIKLFFLYGFLSSISIYLKTLQEHNVKIYFKSYKKASKIIRSVKDKILSFQNKFVINCVNETFCIYQSIWKTLLVLLQFVYWGCLGFGYV